MSVEVQTEVFQGPFDLLLHLIISDDVDLYQINLSDIVDQYLAEVARIQNCDLEISTEFLLIAATLIELKCRRLLPSSEDVTLDDELGIWEERDLLLAKLLECKTFKDVSREIRTMLELGEKRFSPQAGIPDPYASLAPDPLENMTSARLQRAFIKVTATKPVEQVSLRHIAQLRWTVSDAISEIHRKLSYQKSIKFSDLVEPTMERIEVVVHFLAALELFKQGQVDLRQVTNFSELEIVALDAGSRNELELVDIYDG